MKKSRLAAAAALVLLSACSAAMPRPGPDGTIDLFNGKDLEGWVPVGRNGDRWRVADGVLTCDGGGEGWLSTAWPFRDFVLELEFQVPPDGNSGVFLRAPRQGDPAHTAMEIQILDDATKFYGKLRKTQMTGSIYDVVAPAHPVGCLPDMWNRYRICCRGNQVTVDFNGERVVEADMDALPKLKKRPREGYIGFQNHGSFVYFRNVRLRPLGPASP